MTYDIIPSELKSIDHWVTWRFEEDPKHPDKPKKVPYNPYTGRRADTTNPKTWGAFALALRAARTRQHTGIGFVFAPDDPFVGIDLDDCIDERGAIADWAREILDEMNSYSEISPSQHGIKLIVEGQLPQEVRSIKTTHVEIYDSGRYFTITGQHVAGTPTAIRFVNGALADLCARMRPQPEPGDSDVHSVLTTRPVALDDEHIHVWAERLIDQAASMLALEPDGNLHNKRIDMGRWVGGLIPHGLATADELARRLYNARIPKSHHTDEMKTIRDGITMGAEKPLTLPPAPPQPLLDGEGFACCPIHETRLVPAKNGNGYKCRQRDSSTASGWCDFWWKGTGYVEPQTKTETLMIAGEVITATPALREAAPLARYRLYRMDGLRALPPVSWLIPGELPAGQFTVVCGPSGAGKSFFTVECAMRVARAYPDRIVIYVAPEGGSGYRSRVEAWVEQHGGEEPQNIAFVLEDVAMLDPRAVNEFISAIHPFNPVLVVIDTLARCMVGGDENSAKDMGLFVSGCDSIRRETGAAILVVHHSGKSGTGYRGSSALFASSDSWIDVANDDGLITVSCGKAKDWIPFSPRYLRLVERGESCILIPSDQVTQRNAKLTEGQRKTLETLALDIFTEPGAKRSELVGATGIPEATMYRVLSRLKRDGLIEQGKRGDPYRITNAGMTEIKNYHRDLRQQREKLSNSHETITNSHDSSITNYQTITSPPLGGRVIVDSDSASKYRAIDYPPQDTSPADNSELFVDDPPAMQPPATNEPPPGFKWEVVRRHFAAQNIAGIHLHCQLWRQDFEAVLAQLEAENAE